MKKRRAFITVLGAPRRRGRSAVVRRLAIVSKAKLLRKFILGRVAKVQHVNLFGQGILGHALETIEAD